MTIQWDCLWRLVYDVGLLICLAFCKPFVLLTLYIFTQTYTDSSDLNKELLISTSSDTNYTDYYYTPYHVWWFLIFYPFLQTPHVVVVFEGWLIRMKGISNWCIIILSGLFLKPDINTRYSDVMSNHIFLSQKLPILVASTVKDWSNQGSPLCH